MPVTIIIELTNKLLLHVSTHEVSFSGSSLVLAKITYECTENNELPEDDTSCVETCRSSLFVISIIIITDIYVHSLVELKIKKYDEYNSTTHFSLPVF